MDIPVELWAFSEEEEGRFLEELAKKEEVEDFRVSLPRLKSGASFTIPLFEVSRLYLDSLFITRLKSGGLTAD